MVKIVSGTGHRPNKLEAGGKYAYPAPYKIGYGYAYNRLVGLAAYAIQDSEASYVISGMALGWDMALAQAAIFLDVPFTAAVPFEGQESQWPDSSQKYFQYLLSKADDVTYVCDAGYAPWKMQKRNEWMVEHSDEIVALWNGTTGGTGNCISYATRVNKPIRNYWDMWSQHKDDKFEFSNFQLVPIYYGDGITYPSVENFYQAMKTKDVLLRKRISTMTPAEAKKFGGQLTDLREDWDEIKLSVMRWGLQKKFDNAKFQTKLIRTVHKPLIEWNWWNDTYWGVDIRTETGENHLGQLIMEIREQYV